MEEVLSLIQLNTMAGYERNVHKTKFRLSEKSRCRVFLGQNALRALRVICGNMGLSKLEKSIGGSTATRLPVTENHGLHEDCHP